PAIFDLGVAAFSEALFAQSPTKLGYKRCMLLHGRRIEESNQGHHRLLRARRERPRRRAADERDEFAPPHSITSSAMASTPGGMVTPSASAVCRLMTSSNLVACRIGRSAGFSPLRIRAT